MIVSDSDSGNGILARMAERFIQDILFSMHHLPPGLCHYEGSGPGTCYFTLGSTLRLLLGRGVKETLCTEIKGACIQFTNTFLGMIIVTRWIVLNPTLDPHAAAVVRDR